MNQKKEFHMKRELFLKPFPSDLSLKKKDLDLTVFRDLKLLLQVISFLLREVSFFTRRGGGLLKIGGIRYFFLDQKGDQKIFSN